MRSGYSLVEREEFRTMEKPRNVALEAPEYDATYLDFFWRAVENELGNYEVLQRVDVVSTRHTGIRRTVFNEPFDQQPTLLESVLLVHGEWVRDGELFEFNLFVRAFAEKSAHGRLKALTKHLEEGTRASGQILPGNPSLTWNSILEAMEHMPPQFSSDGEPRVPEILAAPGAWLNLRTSTRPMDFDERLKAIIERKRIEWNAQKRTRRIPHRD